MNTPGHCIGQYQSRSIRLRRRCCQQLKAHPEIWDLLAEAGKGIVDAILHSPWLSSPLTMVSRLEHSPSMSTCSDQGRSDPSHGTVDHVRNHD